MEIKITPGSEHEPKWISREQKEDLFHETFLHADEALKEIFANTEKYDKDIKEFHLQREQDIELLYRFSNNVIAFCGNRGQGKTSVMISFVRNLNQENYSKKFLILPTIDPTMLEVNDSILNVILSRLFLKAKNIWECENELHRNSKESIRRELIECFQTCMKGIKTNNTLKEKLPDEFDSLEQLEKLGDSTNLKKNFLNLIRQLILFSGHSVETSYVVIPLDDTDLQFQSAYNILEDLRKYLSIPHVVLLMAIHLDQMRDLIEKQYVGYFNNIADRNKIHLRASRYIDKIFPAKYIVFLPQFEKFCRDKYRSLTLSYGKEISNKPLQEGLISYIYQKTGLLFVVPSQYLHNIIPSNLRGLNQLLNLLYSMKNLPKATVHSIALTKENKKDLYNRCDIALQNLQLFENYFLHEWCINELIPEHGKLLEAASNVAISIQIPKLYNDIKKFVYSDEKEIAEEILADTDKNDEVIYSLLIELLDKLAEKRDAQTYKFCFAVHTYVTILLHKIMWWTRAYLSETKKGPSDKDSTPVSNLSYNDIVDILEGTIFSATYDEEINANHLLKDSSEYTVSSNDLKKIPTAEKILIRVGKNHRLYYDYTRFVCGCLLEYAGQIVNNDELKSYNSDMLYFLQEFSLMIVTNWDIQEILRKIKISDKELDSPLEIYSELKNRLEDKQIDNLLGSDFEYMFDNFSVFWKLPVMNGTLRRVTNRLSKISLENGYMSTDSKDFSISKNKDIDNPLKEAQAVQGNKINDNERKKA